MTTRAKEIRELGNTGTARISTSSGSASNGAVIIVY